MSFDIPSGILSSTRALLLCFGGLMPVPLSSQPLRYWDLLMDTALMFKKEGWEPYAAVEGRSALARRFSLLTDLKLWKFKGARFNKL